MTSLDIQKGYLKAVSQMTDLELCLKCEEAIQCCSPKAKNGQGDEQLSEKFKEKMCLEDVIRCHSNFIRICRRD